MARKASSGFAKFELVDSAMTKTSIHAGRARNRRIQRRSRRVTEARRDIAVGPQQIGRSGFGIVARAGKSLGIDKAVIAADADHADAFRRLGGDPVAEFQ